MKSKYQKMRAREFPWEFAKSEPEAEAEAEGRTVL